MKKLLTMLAVICLAAVPAAAAGESPAGTETAQEGLLPEGPVTEEKALDLAGSSVRFPAVSGMEDEALQARINEQIRADLHTDEYLERVNALISDESRSITVTWDGGIAGDVFSAALDAEGAVKTLRSTQVWTWSSVDLRDGHEITLEELFTDAETARERLESYLEETVAPEMSPMLPAGEWTPLPEGFRLDAAGLTLLYDAEQVTLLSGRAGAVKIAWNEIRDAVDWSEDGIPARIGAAEMVTWTADNAERIRAMTESGQLPGIPAKIGDSVKEWTDREHLLNDPEEYALGRMFELEGAAFRNVFLLSDAVSGEWDSSRIQGIRMDRGCAWGLCIGETAAAEWHELLGEPDETAELDEEDAENHRTVPGTCDYYEFGAYRLQLQADADGILVSIALTE